MRINLVNLILGKRGCGKTTFVRKLIALYRAKHIYRKILIVSTIDQPGYKDIPIIEISHLKRWKGSGTYRIFGSNTNEILEAIEEHFRGGLLVMEDSTAFIPKIIPEKLRRMIIDTKQKDVDMIMVFHGFMSTPPEILRYTDTLTFFKTDTPDSRKEAIGAYYNDVLTQYNNVMASTNQYIYKTVKIN
jgi:energy-coupling factor transporter ATP-binding protein EcfA2